ncbi:hypothetical protein GCM10019017_40640 [Streptomyces showdoensis]
MGRASSVDATAGSASAGANALPWGAWELWGAWGEWGAVGRVAVDRHALRGHGGAERRPGLRALGGRHDGPFGGPPTTPSGPGRLGGPGVLSRDQLTRPTRRGTRGGRVVRTAAAASGRLGRGAVLGHQRALQEGVRGGAAGASAPAAVGAVGGGRELGARARVRDPGVGGGLRGKRGQGGQRTRGPGPGVAPALARTLRRRRGGDGAAPGAEGELDDVRAAGRPRHLVRLDHTVVRVHDPAHDRLVDGVAARVRAADLDPDDVAALCGRDDDRGVGVAARLRGLVLAGGVDPGHVGDEVGQRGDEPSGVDLGLDRRGVDGELGPAGPDQLDGVVDAGRHDPVQQDDVLGERLGAGVEALVAEHVVDEGGHPGVSGGQMVQHLVGLGPQLPGVVGGEGAELGAQLLQRPAQGLGEDGRQLLVPGGERGVPLPLLLQLGQVPLGPVGDLAGVLLDELLVRPAVGEGHDGADELVPVAHRRGGEVDRHPVAVLRPEDLAADAVLAAGLEGVGERRLGVREGLAVRAGVQHQGVQLLAAEVGGAEAEDLRGGRVDEDDAPVGVGADDALGRRPQDHLGLALRTGQLRLGVEGPGEIPYDQHEQLVAGVAAVRVVGLAAVLQAGAGHLDGELAAVRTAGDHPGRLGAAPLVRGLGPAHGARDEARVELGEQIEQPAPDERGAGGLEHAERDRVGVDDRAVAIDEHEAVREGVEYGCEASSASGWPAAHDDGSSLTHCTCLSPVPIACRPGPSCPSGRGLSRRESKGGDPSVPRGSPRAPL